MARAKIVSAIVVVVALISGCSRQKTIRVGSKNFTEQLILGELVTQFLEKRLPGYTIERRLNLGGALLAHQALQTGAIDLYPEYTGTALTAILKMEPAGDPAAVLERVRGEYQKRFGITWLDPLGFNNTFAMVIRGEDARARKIETLSAALAVPDAWALGMGYEFQTRPDGLPALDRVYRPRWRASPKSMDLGLLLPALQQKSVDMIAANQTDGLLSASDVKILTDDKQAFPPYQAAIAVRQDVLGSTPGLEEALRSLSGKIPEDAMRRMNFEVDGKKRSPREVAAAWLNSLQN